MQLQELEKKKIHDQAAFRTNCKIKIELNLSPILKETIAIIRYKIGQTIPNTKLGGFSGLLINSVYQVSELICVFARDPIIEVKITSKGKIYFITSSFF